MRHADKEMADFPRFPIAMIERHVKSVVGFVEIKMEISDAQYREVMRLCMTETEAIGQRGAVLTDRYMTSLESLCYYKSIESKILERSRRNARMIADVMLSWQTGTGAMRRQGTP